MKFSKIRSKLLRVKNLYNRLWAGKIKENKMLEKLLILKNILYNLSHFQRYYQKRIERNTGYKLDIDWKDKTE